MKSTKLQVFLLLQFSIAIVLFSEASIEALGQETSGGGRRALLSFKETPAGSNVTFECSPSGPCVSCLYSEKSDEKYRCSETGYRIPLKCVEIKDNSKDTKGKTSKEARSTLEVSDGNAKVDDVFHNAEGFTSYVKHRSLLDDSSTSENGLQAYITYRSCIPPVNEEKVSVVGFEGIMLGLLFLSGPVVYFRRKRTISASGFARIQTNSRF
ncbi:Mediator of DNA damage checkpoint protein 1 [Quillaja saponaria]|uniref:Mediator of DNA damage checkpoint protein 1 n=1 Tax=Quillaja saponaria TaxID=32244 RepID=A0AAD7PFI9_QUISA|nr:Mediator of DNA damage checkpoint protein 1 [Quillaja saponaria]